MARVQIKLPEKFAFTAELTVRVSDLNYGAHLGHDSVLTLMQEARVLFYRSLGYKDETSFEGSVGHVVSDAALLYKSEAFLGDVLEVKIAVADFSRYGFDLYYQLVRKDNTKEVARGKTGVVCFDFERRRVAPVPQSLLDKLQ